MSFDLLNRQPTDPPDVSSLEESLSQLQDLISSGTLTVHNNMRQVHLDVTFKFS